MHRFHVGLISEAPSGSAFVTSHRPALLAFFVTASRCSDPHCTLNTTLRLLSSCYVIFHSNTFAQKIISNFIVD
ncbi:hypothetical protein CIT292_07874 [Citrobacter youngae ATCC 29220]|uniref:Uncharacterized protein n=1 Tax=Citrobacter youngae ATCC 29220 TaxID=500640 RepID=D4BBT5_9ENTR|nr:hypothetical protein CIT292_07874 [Citrobacter youngae ATCC 29220]